MTIPMGEMGIAYNTAPSMGGNGHRHGIQESARGTRMGRMRLPWGCAGCDDYEGDVGDAILALPPPLEYGTYGSDRVPCMPPVNSTGNT